MDELKLNSLKERLDFVFQRIPSEVELIRNNPANVNYYILASEYPVLAGNIEIMVKSSYEIFPEEYPIFKNIIKKDANFNLIDRISLLAFVDYLKQVIKKKEDNNKDKYDDKKIFLNARDRISEAGKSFRENNYPSCISNVHTAIEVVLKDKLKIPPTIEEIHIGPIVGYCIRNKVFPSLKLFLEEIHKKANLIDNDYKHKSYNPARGEALTALSLGEKFVFEIENLSPNLPDNFLDELSKNIKFLKN